MKTLLFGACILKERELSAVGISLMTARLRTLCSGGKSRSPDKGVELYLHLKVRGY